jgi:hypothetical protein
MFRHDSDCLHLFVIVGGIVTANLKILVRTNEFSADGFLPRVDGDKYGGDESK